MQVQRPRSETRALSCREFFLLASQWQFTHPPSNVILFRALILEKTILECLIACEEHNLNIFYFRMFVLLLFTELIGRKTK